MPLKRLLKILKISILSLIAIVVLLTLLVNLPPVQNFMAQKAVRILSDKLHTRVSLEKIELSLFNEVQLNKLYIEDQHKDTLLFAGEASIKITDWFFIKKKPVLTYVGLKNAQVNLNRSKNSDIWNYQFIIDAFASKKPKKKDTSSSSFDIDLRQINLSKVNFNMLDAWVGSDMVGAVGDFSIDANHIDFDKKHIDIASIIGDEVLFGLRDYKGGRPPKPHSNTVPPIDTTPFNPGKWTVAIGKLTLANSHFFLNYPETKAPEGMFDPEHMDVRNIDAEISNIAIAGDTLTANLKHLSAKERCGFEIKKIAAKVKVSPIISECKNLELITGNSHLSDYYAMRYKRFPDFLDYIQKVVMEGHLNKSEVAIQDIAYFAPALARYRNLSVILSGKGIGTVDNLTMTDLKLDDGMSTLSGNLSLKGLPDIDATYMDYQNGVIQTNGLAAYVYAPEIRNQESIDLKALQSVIFKGSFTGLLSDFKTKGTLSTNLGNIIADAHMKLPYGKQSSYTGHIATNGFDIGKLLKQDILGKASVDFNIDGRGFDAHEAAINIKGKVKEVFIKGYNYRDITVNGLLAANKFEGTLNAFDPNLQLNFAGKINFPKNTVPSFDLYAQVQHINLNALGFTPDTVIASGEMKFDFSGSTIDNFIGEAQLYNVQLKQNNIPLQFDSLQLVSTVDESGYKELQLNTGELHADITGHFSLIDLPQSAQMFLSYYLPEYVKKPTVVNTLQDLKFDVQVGNFNDIIALFNKSLKIGAGAHFNGAMDMPHQELSLAGTVPSLDYGVVKLNNIQINSIGTFAGLKIDAQALGISAADNDIASTVQFQANMFNDSASFQLLTTTPTTIGSAEVNGVAYANNDSFYVHFLPSQFYLNNDKWEIPEGNQITFAKNYVAIRNVSLGSGAQELNINSQGEIADNRAYVQIKNLDITPLNRILGLEDLYIDGRINGNIRVTQLFNEPKVNFDLNADNLRVNNDTLGTVRAAGNYDAASALLSFEPGSGLSYKNSKAEIEGTYSLKKESNENIDASLNFNHAEIKWAEPFLAGYVHQLSGEINGRVDIKGNASNPVTTGQLTLSNAGFVPDIIGVHYNIPEANINVSGTKFEMGSIHVFDDDKNEGVLGGNISHTRLSNFNFRLNLRSDNIKVLDLKDYQNENFYGDVNASVQLRLSGPANNLNLNIFATPLHDAHLYIPIKYGTDVSEYSYVHFKQYGEVPHVAPTNKNKFNIRIDAVATPDLEATIILDPKTGEKITAKGSGNIILEIPSEGEMRMNGNYVIDQGVYNYSFKQLQVLNYKRDFIINPGSVIKWNGDIANADLDVSAYAQIKARLYDLIINEVERASLSSREVQDAQILQMVNVNMNMKGSLNEPEFHFRIDLAENRSVGTYAYLRLQRINADDKELYTQVASLLLLEQFVPPEGINNSTATAGVINNMSELISSAASSQFTNFANKILGMEDLSIGVKYKYYSIADNSSASPNFVNRNEAGFNLRKNFLKNRLIVEVGGVYDWGRSNAQANDLAGNFAGDFKLQYLLTADGRIRFNVFRTNDYDPLFSQLLGRQGVGISYRKSFNGLLDLFRSEEKVREMNEKRMQEERARHSDTSTSTGTDDPSI